jgi:uncharacterized protein YqiB (DUF1249 family)
MSNELTTQERAVRIARVKMRGEQLATMETQYVLVAAKTGEDLLWLKANCEHGEFKTEFAKEFPGLNYPRATQWMKIAKEFPELLDDSKVAAAQHLNYTQVIELLSAPTEIREEVIERIEKGDEISSREIQRLKKEAADLLAEKDTIQFALAEKQARLDWLEMDKKAIHEQNDQLRNTLAFEVDKRATEKLELERAKLILENQQAIAQAKRDAENAKGELERLKKEQSKAIKDGVERELQNFDRQIEHKEGVAKVIENRIKALREVEMSLEREVGYLQIHKKAIEKIKDNLSFLAVSFSDAFDTETIPTETVSDWTAIYDALNKLVTQMREWRENNTLIGELVD